MKNKRRIILLKNKLIKKSIQRKQAKFMENLACLG
jgi:hypothetical protein